MSFDVALRDNGAGTFDISLSSVTTTTTTTTTVGTLQWKFYVGDIQITTLYVGDVELTQAYIETTPLKV